MLNEGLATMAVGMGTVFSFLVILWIVVMGLGKIVAYLNKIFPEQVQVVNQPLLVTSMGNKYDIVINVTGGGLNGQAAACLHGISRALVQIDPDARTSLKANGYLTRDSRMVERKKYGQRGARRRFQFSKR